MDGESRVDRWTGSGSKLMPGKSRPCQSQGSVVWSSQDVLVAWLTHEERDEWKEKLRFIKRKSFLHKVTVGVVLVWSAVTIAVVQLIPAAEGALLSSDARGS